MGKNEHKRSYAAFASEDVADAKRGHPEVSLEPWATARGLTYEGSSLPGQFSTVLPPWPDYVFNLSKGTVAPGSFGCLAHELDEVGADGQGSPAMPGAYHALRYHGKSRGLMSVLFSIDTKKVPNEPFARDSFWLPITQVVIRVPAMVLLPAITIRTANRFPVGGNPKLDDGGLPGFRMLGSKWVDEPLRLAVAGACRPLASLGTPYAGVRIDCGLLAVFRNGFVTDDASLDALTAVAGQIAHGLTQLAWGATAPQPFVAPLPQPDSTKWPAGYLRPGRDEVEAIARAAQVLGMVEEDPVAYHRSQPRCPAPGRAIGLVRGTLPGTTADGRVGFFAQGRHTGGTYRSVVMVPAREGSATPLGGQRDEASDLYVEVVDGVAYAWPRARTEGGFESVATAEAAVLTLRRLGLADL